MSFSWDRFHSDCRQVSDASIICEDGVIFTHKLVLATVSELLQKILSDIPAADEVTFYLKTYEKSKVEEFFNDLLHQKDCSHAELCSVFGVDTSLKKPLGLPLHVQGGPWPTRLLSELGSQEEPQYSSILKDPIKTGGQIIEVKVKEENATDDLEKLVLESDANIAQDQDDEKKAQEDLNKVKEDKVKEYEKELIKNPKTKKDFIQNKKVNQKIRYEIAFAFFKSGQAQSLHHAACKYGVDPKTLKKLVLNGGSYRGTGMVLKRFSKEEEKAIAKKALQLYSSEENVLTYRLLEKVILEEADIVRNNQPERSDQMLFTTTSLQSFSRALAVRNGILDRVNSLVRRDQDKRRTYVCEICQSAFTFQNILVKHRKRSHSFLY